MALGTKMINKVISMGDGFTKDITFGGFKGMEWEKMAELVPQNRSKIMHGIHAGVGASVGGAGGEIFGEPDTHAAAKGAVIGGLIGGAHRPIRNKLRMMRAKSAFMTGKAAGIANAVETGYMGRMAALGEKANVLSSAQRAAIDKLHPTVAMPYKMPVKEKTPFWRKNVPTKRDPLTTENFRGVPNAFDDAFFEGQIAAEKSFKAGGYAADQGERLGNLLKSNKWGDNLNKYLLDSSFGGTRMQEWMDGNKTVEAGLNRLSVGKEGMWNRTKELWGAGTLKVDPNNNKKIAADYLTSQNPNWLNDAATSFGKKTGDWLAEAKPENGFWASSVHSLGQSMQEGTANSRFGRGVTRAGMVAGGYAAADFLNPFGFGSVFNDRENKLRKSREKRLRGLGRV